MPLDLSVVVSKPTRILSKPWESHLMALARNARGLKLNGCTIEPLSRVAMLSPKYHGEGYNWGKSHWNLFPNSQDFLEAKDMYGVPGSYVGWAGGMNTAWSAYLNASTLIAADRGIVFNIFWQPSPNAFAPSLEFFPRVDLSRYATIGGYVYYFCPIIIVIDTQANLTVYEYQHDNYTTFENNPAALLERTYQHSLLLGPNELNQQFLSITILPIENDGFALLCPQAKDGGFAYYSKLTRTTVKMFPEGSAGLRSLSGGLSMFNIYPVDFETSGTIIGPAMAKREDDDSAVTVTVDAWKPTGTNVTAVAIDPTTEQEIASGTTFQDYTYKLTLTGNGNVTPVVYYVKAEVEGSGEDKTPDTIDISADVSISDQTSEDVTGYRATVRLRNIHGQYNELLYRPLNEIDYDLLGADRAILYTLNPRFGWWETPRHEALFIEWECVDWWGRLGRQLCGNEIAYDGLDLKTAVETFLERQGWDPNKIDVHSDAESIVLPSKRGSGDYIFKPQDGSSPADFLRQLHENFCSTWAMYIGGDGTFHLQPCDTEVSRTFYLCQADGAAAYAADYAQWQSEEPPPEPPEPYQEWLAREPKYDDYTHLVLGKMDVQFMHEDFANEVWVVGTDSATRRPLVAVYLDTASQTDEEYIFYVGERRIIYVPCPLINKIETLQWICAQIAAYYCTVRRRISFRTKYDPSIRPTDIITFYGTELTFRVTSTNLNVGPNTWGRNSGSVFDHTIEAIEWPVA